jgi:hypothetical protein
MSFDEWYEKYERDGGELMLFNANDLREAWIAGHTEGVIEQSLYEAENK